MTRSTRHGLALLLLGLAWPAACSGHHGQRHVDVVRGRFPLAEDQRELRVRVPMGSLTFDAGPPGEVSFEANALRAADTTEQLEELRRIPLTLTPAAAKPGMLRLVAPDLPEHADPAQQLLVLDTVLRVPPGLRILGRTRVGHLAAKEVEGDLDLRTGKGDLWLRRCVGKVRVETGRGNVTIDHHRGSLDVHTTMGSMQVFVAEVGPAGIRLVTDSGSIQAHLPADAAFVLDARTAKGEAINGFGVPVRERRAGGLTGQVMQGPVRGGGPTVYLRSRMGNISVRPKVYASSREREEPPARAR